MKKILTLLAAIVLSVALHAQSLNWMKQISGTGYDYLMNMTTDASGNIYVVGGFTGTIDMDPGPGTLIKMATGSDVWLAKYTSDGTLVWGDLLTGGDDDFGLDIALDNSGNVYISGYYGSQPPNFDFDPNPIDNIHYQPGGSGAFFAKYTNSGTFVWAKVLTGAGGGTRVNGIAVDGNSNIYIAGSMSNGTTVDFDPAPGGNSIQNRSASNGQIFYAKYNSSGIFQWAKNTSTSSGNQCLDLALDGSNNLIITGSFSGTTDFNPDGSSTNFINTAGSAYIAKYNTNGSFQWANTLAGQAGDVGKRCGVDGSNNIFFTGKKISNNGDIFLAKYASTGTLTWPLNISGSENDSGQSLFVDGSSYVYIGGYFTGAATPINFNPLKTPIYLNLPQYDNDFYVSKYNSSDGSLVWARNLDLTLNAPDYAINSMRISNNKIVLAGNLNGSGDFNYCGSSSVYNATTLDAFITGYNTTDAALSITGPGAVCNAGTFTFNAQNIPPGVTVSWSTSPSGLVTPSTGTGPSFSVNAINNTISSNVTVTAQVLGNCPSTAQSSIIRVGVPASPGSLNIDATTCPEYYFDIINCITPGTQGITSYTWQYNLEPSGPINVYPNRTCLSPRFTLTPTGNSFRIGVQAINTCGAGPFSTVVVNVPTSCGSSPKLVAFPNPATDQLTVSFASDQSNIEQEKSVDLINNSLERILHIVTMDSVLVIPTTNFKEGTYYLQVTDKKGTEKKQVIIKR